MSYELVKLTSAESAYKGEQWCVRRVAYDAVFSGPNAYDRALAYLLWVRDAYAPGVEAKLPSYADIIRAERLPEHYCDPRRADPDFMRDERLTPPTRRPPARGDGSLEAPRG